LLFDGFLIALMRFCDRFKKLFLLEKLKGGERESATADANKYTKKWGMATPSQTRTPSFLWGVNCSEKEGTVLWREGMTLPEG
jgi:hypothetical protein